MGGTLERYEIIEEIGQGGFATVYRARDTQLDRLVALKALKPALLHDTAWVRRFRREARTIARLDHPHIVPIYDVYETARRLFIVMRLVEGPTLEEQLAAQGRLAWAEALDIFTGVAAGLDYAHEQGILHRDLKPGNILLDEERGAMLTDFGMAKLVGELTTSVTAAGSVVGTPHYIAPEIWEGEGTTRHSDIYALACMLPELVTGQKIFDGDTPPAVMMAHFKPPRLPATWPDDVPAAVSEVLETALARDPDRRYDTAGQFVQALVDLPNRTSPPPASRTKPKSSNGVTDHPPLAWSDSAADRLSEDNDNNEAKEKERADEADDEADNADNNEALEAVMSVTAADSPNSKAAWRGFLGHLGPYVMVIGLLAVINFLTDPGGYPWFIWPALGWGVGLAFHLMGVLLSEMKSLSNKWRGFLGHAGSYAIIMGLLIAIYLMSDPGGYPWFIWPALGWGVAVAMHLWGMLLGKEETTASRMSRPQKRADRHHRRQARRTQQRVERQTAAPTPAADQPAAQSQVASQLIQAHLDKAAGYQRQIDDLLRSTSNRHIQQRLQDLAAQVREWTQAIETLAHRIDDFQQNSLIQQDLESVPQAIAKLERQLAAETDPATKAELERTLANRQNQWAALQHLSGTMKRAEIKIESTLSSLGTIYSQMLISQSTDHVADYGRLSEQVDEEVRTLQDHLEALEEVKVGKVQDHS